VTNTCCIRLHFLTRSPADFGDGPGTASCDLLAVKGVLSTMIDAKVEHLFAQGLVFEARVYAGLKHWFMRGLPSSSDMKGDAPGGACTVSAKEGLAAAIEMFSWRGEEEEAEETRRSGVNLLFWSTLADNLGAVRALATEGNAYPGGRLQFHRPGKRCVKEGVDVLTIVAASSLYFFTSVQSLTRLSHVILALLHAL
jgi:hypothetical protein